MELRCSSCGETKPETEFYPSNTTPRGRQYACRTCQSERQRKRYRSDPAFQERQRAAFRQADERRRTKSGLTREDAAALCAEAGECSICGATDDLVVDHCHRRLVVRGVLCGRCNTGIGFFDDDPARLLAAAGYLRLEAA